MRSHHQRADTESSGLLVAAVVAELAIDKRVTFLIHG